MPLPDSLPRVIFDAVPIPLFVCDSDVRILHANAAAHAAFGGEAGLVLDVRGGEALHCLHSTDVPEGCGTGPFCERCVIRSSVYASLAGTTVHRRRMKFQRQGTAGVRELDLLITSTPLPGSPGQVLIMVEDVSEFTALKSIIPICMKCKRVRTDEQYWQDLEAYFHTYVGVDFSHGICPICRELLFPGIVVGDSTRKNE